MNNQTIDNSKGTIVRPPIVVVLGHVDHGKSSLLEAIREEFKITSRESGGITQHIGAYVAAYQGKQITFLDTPGHEAFSAMRSRGARVADIAILVVAADEGIKPQTLEAIKVIMEAELPFVVAINKIDKPGADPERVKGELGAHGVYLESLGGTVPFVLTSATTKQGIPELLEMILLMWEVEGVKADLTVPGQGIIIEAAMDSQRGPIATLLLHNGTLKTGDVVGTKTSVGKIKMLEDFEGNSLKVVNPGIPAMIIGFEQAPGVGEEFKVFEDEESARKGVPMQEDIRNIPVIPPKGEVLPIILKADVTGSLEALEGVLNSLPQNIRGLKIVYAGIGDVNEKDVKLAQGIKAKIYAFRVKAQKDAGDYASREGISIETFDIIYDLIQRIREILEKPEIFEGSVRKDLGSLKVLAVFFTDKNRQVVGGRVQEGEVRRGSRIEVVRNDQVVGKGKLTSLQKAKQETSVVEKGEECGIALDGDVRIQEGDILKFFIEEKGGV